MPNSIHDGHRERVRAEILEGNFNSKTPPHKVLEALLFYSIPRGDTNELAHKLIDRFGGFEQVFEADIKTLMTVKGVGEKTAMHLRLIGIAIKRSYENRHREIKRFNSMDDLGNMLLEKYHGINQEMVSVVCFDAMGKLVGFYEIGEGDLGAVGISIRSVFEVVIESKAATVVLVHNHPGGQALPSQSDLDATKRLAEALKGINVYLADHILLEDNDYVSLKISPQFKYLFE